MVNFNKKARTKITSTMRMTSSPLSIIYVQSQKDIYYKQRGGCAGGKVCRDYFQWKMSTFPPIKTMKPFQISFSKVSYNNLLCLHPYPQFFPSSKPSFCIGTLVYSPKEGFRSTCVDVSIGRPLMSAAAC